MRDGSKVHTRPDLPNLTAIFNTGSKAFVNWEGYCKGEPKIYGWVEASSGQRLSHAVMALANAHVMALAEENPNYQFHYLNFQLEP